MFEIIFILNYSEKTDFQSSDIYSGCETKTMSFLTFETAREQAKVIQKNNKYTHSFWIEKKEVYYLGY